MNPDEELAKLVLWAKGVMLSGYAWRYEYDAARRFLRFHEYLSDGNTRRLPMAWMSPK